MRIQTFSIVAGSAACNARCPFCVSRMTPAHELTTREPAVNWRNFGIACRFAKDHRVSTVLITGKGEPTLFPAQIGSYLDQLAPYAFPFVELQTNGIALATKDELLEQARGWYQKGLTLIALSVVHHEAERNRRIYQPHAKRHFELAELVDKLHQVGIAVRLSVTLVREAVDDVAALESMAAFCRAQGVEQLTLRPVEMPASSRDPQAAEWIAANKPPAEVVETLRDHLDHVGTRLMELVHGAVVYDLGGQNICLSNCLTIDPQNEQIRQLIFFPDGHLRYDWQYPGAILL